MILEIISKDGPALQAGTILREIESRLSTPITLELEQEALTEWYELFRTGYLAWGQNLNNPDPPFCHLTKRGKRALTQLSRDPSNPRGYFDYLRSKCKLNDISQAYLEEGIQCYVAGMFKASAVMIGAASERMILDIRDDVIKNLENRSLHIPKDLKSWKIKAISKELKIFFDKEKLNFNQILREKYESFWEPFIQQIRIARNEAGHPKSIEASSEDSVHASLLIFPELAKLADDLKSYLV